MQTDGQGELGPPQSVQGQFRQLRQCPGNTHGAHGDPTLTNPQIIVEAANRLENSSTVQQGLSHSHEHDVRGAPIHGFPNAQHLIHDLVGAQRTLQSVFSGGAEATGHGATHLAGDTDGQSLIRGNTDGFNRFAIVGGQQQFGGGIGRHRAVHLTQATDMNTLLLQPGTPGLGQNGDVVQRACPFGIKPIVELTTAERLLPLGHRPVLQLGRAATEQGLIHQISRP